jgi:hypothetical protein
MEQSPRWEADSRSVGQKIPRIFRNRKVCYQVHKSPPLVSVLSQMNQHYSDVNPHGFSSVEWLQMFTLKKQAQHKAILALC